VLETGVVVRLAVVLDAAAEGAQVDARGQGIRQEKDQVQAEFGPPGETFLV
jgi:hypothetical protein